MRQFPAALSMRLVYRQDMGCTAGAEPRPRGSATTSAANIHVRGSASSRSRLSFRSRFPQQALQKIGNSQPWRPSVEVEKIQPGSADMYDPAQVIPLPFGRFSRRAIPAEFAQNRVFRRGHGPFNRITERFCCRELATSELSPANHQVATEASCGGAEKDLTIIGFRISHSHARLG